MSGHDRDGMIRVQDRGDDDDGSGRGRLSVRVYGVRAVRGGRGGVRRLRFLRVLLLRLRNRSVRYSYQCGSGDWDEPLIRWVTSA